MRLLLEGHGLKESFQRGDLEWEGRVVAAYHKLATMEKRMAAVAMLLRKIGASTTGPFTSR